MTKPILQDDQGRLINLENVVGIYRHRTTVYYRLVNNDFMSSDYSSDEIAQAQLNKISAALSAENGIVSISGIGDPTITSIAPNAWLATDHIAFIVTGTNFLPSGRIYINSIDYTKQYISDKTINGFHPMSPPLIAGTYDVVYKDAAGRTATLAGGVTIT